MERNSIFYQSTSSLNRCLRTILGVRWPDTISNKKTMEEDKIAANQLNNKIKTMEVDRAHTEKGK
jgi:hypothetical protein